ncbi:MAG: ABC transporter permease [Deltaproteobacteria bacterium]|nr:ABC transporter permease [Deltaproteobacteria bacterium]
MGALRIVMRNARVWKKFMVSSLVGNLGQPLLFLLAFGFGMGQEVHPVAGYSYLQFIAPGLAASAMMYSAAFETTYGSFTRLGTQSTFEGIISTPITTTELAWGEMIWGALKGLLAGGIMLAVMPLFGLWPSLWALALIPVLFVAGIFFAAIGLIMTALARSYEFFNYFISLVITPLFLFSGIFFSLKDMPAAARLVMRLLPLTPVVNLARMLCYGEINGTWLWQIIWLLLITLAAASIAPPLLRHRLIK